jgi:hypothetical protein
MSVMNLNVIERFEGKVNVKISNPDVLCNAFQLMLWNVFSNHVFTPAPSSISIVGRVLPDGKGDFKTMTIIANFINKYFPTVLVHLIVMNDHKDQLSFPEKENCKFYCYRKSLSEETIEKIKNSTLVFFGPAGIPSLTKIMRSITNKVIQLQEYDFRDTNNEWCGMPLLMGLGDNAAGIFIKKKHEGSLSKITNDKLKEVLFKTQNPVEKDFAEYSQNHRLFFCYFTLDSSANCFFRHASLLADQEGATKNIDICYPTKEDISWLFGSLQKNKKLKNVGIVKLVKYRTNEMSVIPIQLSDCPRVMRIIDVGSISQKDFTNLISLSQPIVGGTGDHTFSSILSQERVLLYEATISHKRALACNLTRITEQLFGNESSIYKYIEGATFNRNFDEISKFVNDPKLSDQAKQLSQYLRSHYALKPILKGLINHRLCQAKDKILEDDLFDRFSEGKISLNETQDQLTQYFEKVKDK